MILYHSAFQIKDEYSQYLGNYQPRILRSFHGNKSTDLPDWCNGIFLDSGAFSAFRSGAVIHIDEYIDFLKKNKDAFDAYAGLDVIGDPEATIKNQEILDSAGLDAVPTYHVGEPYRLLKYYAERYEYIALGGMVPYSGTKMLKTWIRNCWEILNQYDHIKVHAFGLTDLTLSRMYPWYSIDSTTAARAGRTGVLITPWGQLRVSKAIKTKTGATIDTEYKIEQLLKWLNKEMPDLEISWEDISAANVQSSQLRIAINARFIKSIVEQNLEIPKNRKKLI